MEIVVIRCGNSDYNDLYNNIIVFAVEKKPVVFLKFVYKVVCAIPNYKSYAYNTFIAS